MSKKPVALIIMDGWGIREMAEGNAVVLGETPNYDNWGRMYERTVLDASGEAVGLPAGQMGNSEVGHLNLGAGRIVYQDLTRISLAIANGSFQAQPNLIHLINNVKRTEGRLHLIGLFSDGGFHSHEEHFYALLRVCEANGIEPIIHLITDGRDTPPTSGITYVQKLESYLQTHPGIVASISGRYYAMDRDKRWQRTELAYDVIALHRLEGQPLSSASEALTRSYAEGVTDEFVLPKALDVGEQDVTVRPGDNLLFYNFRADRMRQIVTTFVDPDFTGFTRQFIPDLYVATMTNYGPEFSVSVLFPDVDLTNPLAEVLSKVGRRQFHAAETEKYAHVTYFFNGGREQPFPGEERHLEPSPKVPTYDLQPEMSARPLTEAVLERIRTHDDDFILVNFANPDMVGHTGVLEAAITAVETVDECVGRLVEAVVGKGGVIIITADHGNCERMVDLITGKPHTYHTTQPVALFVVGAEYYSLRPRGILADVAPTVLELLGIEQPAEMTGNSLIQASLLRTAS